MRTPGCAHALLCQDMSMASPGCGVPRLLLFDSATGAVAAVLGMDIDASVWKWDVAARAALPVGLMLVLLIGVAAVFAVFISARRVILWRRWCDGQTAEAGERSRPQTALRKGAKGLRPQAEACTLTCQSSGFSLPQIRAKE